MQGVNETGTALIHSTTIASRMRLVGCTARSLAVVASLALAAGCGGGVDMTGDANRDDTPRATDDAPASPAAATAGAADEDVRAAPAYTLRPIVPQGAAFHGVHGLRFDEDDNLYAASVIGQSLFTVDVVTGDVETLIGPPEGMGDDIAIAADGTFVWTAIEDGILYARAPDGPVRRVLEGYKGVNAVSFHPDGRRLFLTLVFYGDALYEVDIYGDTPPRLVAEDIGGLNAFEFSNDGMIYGPLVFGGSVVKIDPESGAVETVSEDFVSPGALKLESQSSALVLDDGAEIKRVDLATGATQLLASLPSGGDNLAIDSTGRVVVSLSETNAIVEVDPVSGNLSYIVEPAPLNSPAGFALDSAGGADTLIVGDVFGGIKIIDVATGRIEHVEVELFQPSRIAVDGDTVLGVSQVFGTIQRFDRESFEVLATWEGFSTPGEVLAIADGEWVVADAGSGRVVRVTGTESRETLAAGLAAPTGLAAAGNDAVYVTETGNGRVVKVELDGSAVQVITAGLGQPEGIATTQTGDLLVVDVGAKALVSVDPDSGEQTAVASDLPIGLSSGPSLYRDVATSDNRIYFNSDIDNTIYELVRQ